MAIIDDFKIRFPEFDSVEVDEQLPLLIEVYNCYWGGLYDINNICSTEIVLNLLAHLMVIQKEPGVYMPRVVQSKSVGNVSESYAADFTPTSGNMGWYWLTRYGRAFWMLTRRRQGGFFV